MPSNDEKKQQQQQLQKRTVSTTTTTFEAGESNDGNATSLRLSSPPPPAATPTPAPTMQCLNGCGGGGVAPTEITKVIIDYEEGDLIGIILNDEIIITHIQKDTRADGKLKIGDRIISMNGRLIKDTDMFYHLIKKMHPQILIVVERKLLKTMLTEERIKQTNFEPNFDTCDYFIAHLSKLHGMQLGLSVKVSSLA
uniref:PDZ domain-containing protein n=1 Tax=Panagrolaimus superbus TaxID=310955 RepID=A0A914YWI9_9BILA